MREKFSTYASRSVKQIKQIPPHWKREHTFASIGFEHYDSLDRRTRADVVVVARQLARMLISEMNPDSVQKRSFEN